MFGSQHNKRPATRLQVGCMGAVFLAVGGFFLAVMALGERDANAPPWAPYAAFAIALSIALAGGWLLFRTVFWDGDKRR